jgi:hypothetical protein
MRIILAAALAASFAGAAWAAVPAKTASVNKVSAITEVVDAKEWSTTRCWICRPQHFEKY